MKHATKVHGGSNHILLNSTGTRVGIFAILNSSAQAQFGQRIIASYSVAALNALINRKVMDAQPVFTNPTLGTTREAVSTHDT